LSMMETNELMVLVLKLLLMILLCTFHTSTSAKVRLNRHKWRYSPGAISKPVWNISSKLWDLNLSRELLRMVST
jgi:hypothetical protein